VRTINWMSRPRPTDYAAAMNYLTLIMSPAKAARIVRRLEKEPMVRRQAKDIIRASGLDLKPRNDPRVARYLRKARSGEALPPVLLVRGQPLIVAEGFHRTCATFWIDQTAEIACKLVDP
jgi:hypothetical protein